MRTREKKRVANKFNDILADIDDMDIENVYAYFDRPYELEETDDTEDILEAVSGLDGNLEYLEMDIQDAIYNLTESLKKFKGLQEKYNALCQMVDDYS